MAILVALAVLAGRWLDGRFGTTPIFLLITCLLSFAVSLYRLLSEAKPPPK